MKKVPVINLLIKPASSSCNLQCKYCFYHDLANKREIKSHGIMKEAVLERIVEEAFSSATQLVTIGFQGGEPTLAGIDFYYKLLDYIDIYNKDQIQVHFYFQTNGILIDQEWITLFKNNDFLVGISLDGEEDIHNENRIDKNGYGTHKKVINAINLLKEHKIEFNVLSVVTNNLAINIEKTYNYLKSLGVKYMQFIPALDPLYEEYGNKSYSLSVDNYQIFMTTLFDLWLKDLKEGNYISIRQFDNLYFMLKGQEPELCTMRGVCSIQNIIESNGDVYPCDFYVVDKWKLGNINEMSFLEMRSSERAVEFIESSRVFLDKCKDCDVLRYCRGGCRRDKTNANGELELNYYCDALYAFYIHALPKIDEYIKNEHIKV